MYIQGLLQDSTIHKYFTFNVNICDHAHEKVVQVGKDYFYIMCLCCTFAVIAHYLVYPHSTSDDCQNGYFNMQFSIHVSVTCAF